MQYVIGDLFGSLHAGVLFNRADRPPAVVWGPFFPVADATNLDNFDLQQSVSVACREKCIRTVLFWLSEPPQQSSELFSDRFHSP